jgi:D-3-phosphoglycerate dehydrogenase
VIYFDTATKLPHGNAQKSPTLEGLLTEADVVSLHVPENAETAGMIGARELAHMKPSAILINNARGTVVDLDALATSLRERRLLGAAIDVFPSEPGSNNERFVTPLQNLPNVILTPHIGGSTAEAQARIGEEVARKLLDYSDVGTTVGAVNFPEVQLPKHPSGTRYMHVHRNVPGLLFRVNDAFAKRGHNIAAEYLQTAGDLGYVVVDAEGPSNDESVLADLRKIDGTIRARLLY